MDHLTIIQPDDWHVHLRDGASLQRTVADSAHQFARAVVMPNLKPPVTHTSSALQYRDRILEHIPAGYSFEPLMTLYLTNATTEEEIHQAADSGVVKALKLYPAGATTNSDAGVTDIRACYPVFRAMAERGLLLLVHGEVTDSDVDIFDREAVFLSRHLAPILNDVPELKVVLEHITTQDSVDFVARAGANIAATITAHHLLFDRNDMLAGGIRPHYYCLPILKRRRHQEALLEAATSGHSRYFLGTDSAPHPVHAKESSCGCAGSYTAFHAMELYATAFESVGALDRLEGFSSLCGPGFYGLPANEGRLRLSRAERAIPETLLFGSDAVRPILAGEAVGWTAALV